ncbi:16S rRNA (guanine(527)-N(7))-methyltransferase RsmG [Helicobacter cetorum]|uniref:16S rRNA (guanine(527)-N(7))-methyltransferase RsmG n=1 Tax=Helicobacter cetorum TaxID=138563 RepID=UPI000CF1741B|nr:16S rRNA (guanine(527)-N(7))-methyltransferase RsmG [Helicobacter cetorum]
MNPLLQDYANILLEWNKTHNLSGARNLSELEPQILDALKPLEFIKDFKTCLDIGSGAGLPAIPLALERPTTQFILLEPRVKRVAFLNYLKSVLPLNNIEIIKKRLEDYQSPLQVDLITSRAVASSSFLIEKSQHLLENKGHFLFYKGEQLKNEIACKDTECYAHEKRIYFYKSKESLC